MRRRRTGLKEQLAEGTGEGWVNQQDFWARKPRFRSTGCTGNLLNLQIVEKTKCHIARLFLLSALLGGCNADSGSTEALVPADSSREALFKVLHALEGGDTEALLPLVDGGSKAQDFFVSIVESAEAADAFRAKLSEVYGAEAWDAFQAPLPPEDQRPDMKFSLPDFARIRADAVAWEADVENDGVFNGLTGIHLPFKEVSEGWVVDGSRLFPDEATLTGFTEKQRKFTSFIARYMQAIGHSGISPEDIDYQMGKDLLIEMMGGEFRSDGQTSNPDRFKIEEIESK